VSEYDSDESKQDIITNIDDIRREFVEMVAGSFVELEIKFSQPLNRVRGWLHRIYSVGCGHFWMIEDLEGNFIFVNQQHINTLWINLSMGRRKNIKSIESFREKIVVLRIRKGIKSVTKVTGEILNIIPLSNIEAMWLIRTKNKRVDGKIFVHQDAVINFMMDKIDAEVSSTTKETGLWDIDA